MKSIWHLVLLLWAQTVPNWSCLLIETLVLNDAINLSKRLLEQPRGPKQCQLKSEQSHLKQPRCAIFSLVWKNVAPEIATPGANTIKLSTEL